MRLSKKCHIIERKIGKASRNSGIDFFGGKKSLPNAVLSAAREGYADVYDRLAKLSPLSTAIRIRSKQTGIYALCKEIPDGGVRFHSFPGIPRKI